MGSCATWSIIFSQNCVQMDKLFALMFALDLNMTRSIKIDSLLKVPRLFRKKEKQRNCLSHFLRLCKFRSVPFGDGILGIFKTIIADKAADKANLCQCITMEKTCKRNTFPLTCFWIHVNEKTCLPILHVCWSLTTDLYCTSRWQQVEPSYKITYCWLCNGRLHQYIRADKGKCDCNILLLHICIRGRPRIFLWRGCTTKEWRNWLQIWKRKLHLGGRVCTLYTIHPDLPLCIHVMILSLPYVTVVCFTACPFMH